MPSWLKKVLLSILAIFLLYFLVTRPDQIIGIFRTIIDAFIAFSNAILGLFRNI
ncbi:MAG: hypothetical protein LBM23_01660 [Propionibacteriaceae bacterium]|jgi:hypothetical protein|nr:hypothetical protein [Propionibacteriaceae bacterium]